MRKHDPHYLPLVRAIVIVGAFTIVSAANSQTTEPKNEDFDLNIAEKRITESNFARSTELRLEGSDLRLTVGVSASAENIDVLLRGITGHVRFRASLDTTRERLRRLFERKLTQ